MSDSLAVRRAQTSVNDHQAAPLEDSHPAPDLRHHS